MYNNHTHFFKPLENSTLALVTLAFLFHLFVQADNHSCLQAFFFQSCAWFCNTRLECLEYTSEQNRVKSQLPLSQECSYDLEDDIKNVMILIFFHLFKRNFYWITSLELWVSTLTKYHLGNLVNLIIMLFWGNTIRILVL